MFTTKGFHEMSDVALATVLQSNDLDIDELDVISAIREWATVNSVSVYIIYSDRLSNDLEINQFVDTSDIIITGCYG